MTPQVREQLRLITQRLPAPARGLARWLWLHFQGASLLAATLVGFVPSHLVRRFLYRHLFGVGLGRGSIIHWQTRFFRPSGVRIGEDCNIGNNAFLDGRSGLTIGDRVTTGAEIMIYTLQHDIDDPAFGAVGAPVFVDDYVYIGPRAVILPGVRIGRGAVVAAAAVVTRDVPEFAVVAGVPARVIGERRRDLDYRPDFAMPFQ